MLQKEEAAGWGGGGKFAAPCAEGNLAKESRSARTAEAGGRDRKGLGCGRRNPCSVIGNYLSNSSMGGGLSLPAALGLFRFREHALSFLSKLGLNV